MAHIHSVFDSNEHFVIDPVTRSIANSLAKKIVVMQYDHNSERFTFEIPKVDGHSMNVCDRVEVHYINIDALDKSLKSTGVYEVTDIQPSPDDNNISVFSWLLSRNATKYAGTLSFLIHFACTTDGVEEYAWNTAIFQSITIGNGMNNGEEVVEPFPDILAQWKADLFGVGDTQEQRLLTVSQEQQAAIAAKGVAVLDSIPDEYEALSGLADQSHRNKAGAIVLDAEGESIVLNDASEYPLMGLKIFGKSTQGGTPSTDAPVDIVSIENPAMMVAGRNLCPESALDTMGINGTSNTYDIATRTITMGADPTGFAGRYCAPLKKMIVGENYTLSFSIRGTSGKIVKCGWDKKGVAITLANDFVRYNVTLTATRENEPIVFYSRPIANGGLSNGEYMQFADVQIEVGEVATDYEPYAEIQTMPTAHTLPGIPVSSGGNYTDADGQQWICDEVDLARGVYVKRVAAERLSTVSHYNENGIYTVLPVGKSKYDTKYICSHFADGVAYANGKTGAYASCVLPKSKLPDSITSIESGQAWLDAQTAAGTPVVAVYVLSEPIETPLSDAEINAFKALHSNKPNTTILNDAGAFMAVEYVADTKTYIDNKISEMLKGGEET